MFQLGIITHDGNGYFDGMGIACEVPSVHDAGGFDGGEYIQDDNGYCVGYGDNTWNEGIWEDPDLQFIRQDVDTVLDQYLI